MNKDKVENKAFSILENLESIEYFIKCNMNKSLTMDSLLTMIRQTREKSNSLYKYLTSDDIEDIEE